MFANQLTISNNINSDDHLYRYVSLAQFLSLIENRKLVLRKIKLWDDPWEAPDDQLPIIFENGDAKNTDSLMAQSTVGQCWTYECDSDAMWRIYSNDRQGIMLETTISKFNLIENLRRAVLARVVYFNSRNYIKVREAIANDRSYLFAGDMALKREAFKHENEVRLLINLQGYEDLFNDIWEIPYAEFSVAPEEFLESITFDPRADKWFVQTMIQYCKSKGIRCPAKKSTLYQKDFFETTHIVRKLELVLPNKNDN